MHPCLYRVQLSRAKIRSLSRKKTETIKNMYAQSITPIGTANGRGTKKKKKNTSKAMGIQNQNPATRIVSLASTVNRRSAIDELLASSLSPLVEEPARPLVRAAFRCTFLALNSACL